MTASGDLSTIAHGKVNPTMKLSHILLAACMFAPLAAHAETPKDRTVAVIEEAGCVLDASNVNEVLDGLGLSDEEFRAIGEELVAEGLADVSEMGVFRLTSPNCPSAPLNAHAGTPKDRTVAVIEEAVVFSIAQTSTRSSTALRSAMRSSALSAKNLSLTVWQKFPKWVRSSLPRHFAYQRSEVGRHTARGDGPSRGCATRIYRPLPPRNGRIRPFRNSMSRRSRRGRCLLAVSRSGTTGIPACRRAAIRCPSCGKTRL